MICGIWNTVKYSDTYINSLIWYRWFTLIDYICNHHSTVCRIFSSLKKFLRVSICHESCLYECWIINNENINAEKLNRIICLFVISYRFSNKFTNYVSDRLMFILLIDTYLFCKKHMSMFTIFVFWQEILQLFVTNIRGKHSRIRNHIVRLIWIQ